MKRFRWVIIVILLFVAWIAAKRLLRPVPPAGVTSVDSFLKWSPGTEQFVVLGSDDQHLMATGVRAGLLPSGPWAYIFDRSGRLVDWSSDIYDDPKFDEKWQAQRSFGSGKPVSRTELSSWLNTATRPAE